MRFKNWVLYEIENAKRKEHVMCYFILIARELVKLNNWHSLQSIMAGLEECSTNPKHKLTWEKMCPDDLTLFQSIRNTILDAKAFYDQVTSLPSPCVPSLEVYLDEIEQIIKECGPVKISDTLVNVKRMMAVGNVIGNFMRAQAVSPTYERVPVIQQYLAIERCVLLPKKEKKNQNFLEVTLKT